MIILSFITELPESLLNYFSSKEIQVTYTGDEEKLEWTHILAREEDLDFIVETFNPIEANIDVIALGRVSDITKFILANGKIVIEESWLEHPLSQLFLDKAINSKGGIALEENYPTFKLNGSFTIVDPYFTSESVDKLIYDALQNKAPAAKVKSYLDHLLLYFSSYKDDFKLIYPFDVSYGTYESVYGVQISFSSREILLDDLSTALNSNVKNPYLYYAYASANFFDISYLNDVNKCTITALWMDQAQNSSGLLINEIKQSADEVHMLIDDSEIDFDVFSNVNITEDEKVTILKSVEVDDRSKVNAHIHATPVEKDIIQIIKGKIEEEKVQIVSGSASFNVDDFSIKVSSGLKEDDGSGEVFKIQALKKELPNTIKERFVVFAHENNIDLNDVKEYHIEAFKEKEVPNLIRIKTKEIDERFSQSSDGKNALSKENLFLKKKMQILLTEVKILKEEKLNAQRINSQARLAAEKEFDKVIDNSSSANAKSLDEMIQKMNQQKYLDEKDTEKLSELLENEARYIREIKEADLKLKKQSIETSKQESFYASELEKLNRQLKAKDLIVTKTKDSFTRLLDKRDKEIANLKDRVSQLSNSLLNKGNGDSGKVTSLERQLQNAQRLANIYRSKLAQKPQVNTVNNDSKDEVRKLTALTNQLKNKLNASSKEVQKLDFKYKEQLDYRKKLETQISELKAQNLDLLTQKESPKNPDHADSSESHSTMILELQNQLKDSLNRQKELEEKLVEAIRAKKEPAEMDTSAKARAAQTEATMKKLVSDLGEHRSQIQKMKQEVQKLRSEKTALQNLLERSKKEQEKLKLAAKNTKKTA